MPAATGATPLFALDAVALDTETTGLDASRSALVQIGAVHISRGILDPAASYERIVDPGMPIPPTSTAVHGITDAMVSGAPGLRDVWADFRSFLGRRVVVGHTIGFDLTVLAAEASRNGLPWKRPRTLCVRMLAMLATPTLASYSIDALASWLGVTIRNRHRALGDAEAAGLIYLALVPRLRERGIRTLAEAERACLRLTPEIQRQDGAGWEAPVSEPRFHLEGEPSDDFDSYAYRHRVSDVMTRPVVVVPPEMTLAAATQIMTSRAITSVFVAASGRPGLNVDEYAILTERDVMRLVADSGADALRRPVGAVASRPIHTVPADSFLYRVIGRMRRLRLRHLGVRSEANGLIGVVSARDLLKLRADPAIVLDDAIEEAVSTAEMARAWATLPAVVNALIAEGIDARIVCDIVSEEIRSMTRRAGALAAEAMRAEGRGGPPCAFTLMVLGSGGRGESLLVPDQDNALVFQAGDPGGPEDLWFAEMGARTAGILDEAGIPYCKGGVMACNAEWRGSLVTWKQRIDRWVRQSRPQDLLNVDIFFDAVPVHGMRSLGHVLFEHAYARGSETPPFVKLLGERVARTTSPLSIFGGLKGRDGRLDLKMHVLFPVVAVARTLAVGHGIAERSTRARIEALTARGIGNEVDLAAVLDAHALGLSLLLAQQSRDIAAGVRPSTNVELASLTRRQRSELKAAIARLQDLPTLLRDLMFERGGQADGP